MIVWFALGVAVGCIAMVAVLMISVARIDATNKREKLERGQREIDRLFPEWTSDRPHNPYWHGYVQHERPQDEA